MLLLPERMAAILPSVVGTGTTSQPVEMMVIG